MGERYLIDTNTVIDYLENKLPLKASAILDNTNIEICHIKNGNIGLAECHRNAAGSSKRIHQCIECLRIK